MKINSRILALIIIVVLFGSYAITASLGLWQTTTDKIPVKYTSGSEAGTYNPADIKGSYDFGTISTLFEIPLDDLAVAFHVKKEEMASFQVKTLEEIWATVSETEKEVGTDSVRLFVAFYKGLPIDMSDSTGLPATAAQVLQEKGQPTAEQLEFIKTHQVTGIATDTNNVSSETVQPESDVTTADTSLQIKGTTTWQEMISQGVSIAALEEAFGGKIEKTSNVIKDDCADKGLEFSSIKTALQALVDK